MVLCLSIPVVHAQTLDVQAADGCGLCTGGASYAHPFPLTISWFDASGALLQAEVSDASTVPTLCPGLYELVLDEGEGPLSTWFTIGTTALDPAQSAVLNVCAGGVDIILDPSLLSAPVGGVWTDEAGLPLGSLVLPADPASSGFYDYTLTDGACTVTFRLTLFVNENADPGLTTTYLICASYTPFALLDFLAGSPDGGGDWFDPTVTEMDGVFDPATMDSGLFTYRIDTVPGCPAVFSTLFVIENPEADPGLPTEVLVCEGGPTFDLAAQIDGTPEMGGTWEDADGDAMSNTFDPAVMPAGIYTYTVQGLTPCPNASVDIEVLYTPGLDPGADGNAAACTVDAPFDLFASLGGSPMLLGAWSGPSPTLDGVLDPATASAGMYSYTLEGVGCATEVSEVNVAIEVPPFAGADGASTVCEDQTTLDLTPLLTSDPAVTTGGAWTGVGVDGGGLLNWAASGEVTLTYEVGAGICPTDAALWTVTVAQLPDAGPDQEAFYCEPGLPLDLNTLATPGFNQTLVWTDGSGAVVDPSVVLLAGTTSYTLTASGNAACPADVMQVDLQVEVPAFAETDAESVVCDTDFPVDLTGLTTFDDAVPGTWTNADGSALDDLLLDEEEAGSFLLTVDNHPDCPPSVLLLEVLVSVQFDAETPQFLSACFDEEAFSLDDHVGATPGLGIWYLAGVEVDPVVNPADLASGAYVLEVAESGPCPATSVEVNVDIDPGLDFDAGPDIALCASEVELLQLGQDPEVNCDYSWTPQELVSDPSASNPFASTVEVDAMETLLFSVIVTNGVCTAYDTVAVDVFPEPGLLLSPDLALCLGEEAVLEAASDAPVLWTGPMAESVIGSEVLWTVVGSATWGAVATNAFGCTTSAEVNIEALPLPEVAVDPLPVSGCLPIVWTPSLQTDQDLDVQWYINGSDAGNDPEPTLVFDQEGDYLASWVVTNAFGCSVYGEADQAAQAYPLPTASFAFSPLSISMDSPYLFLNETGQGADELEWEIDGDYTESAANWTWEYATLEAAPSVEVCLHVASTFGCADTLCRDIPIENTHWVYVPNAFTPDGDGINELFVPVAMGVDPAAYQFTITNRWGEPVFQTQELGKGWMGNHQGGSHFVPEGVYIWTVEVKDLFTSETKRYTGHVTVIR